MKIFFYFIFILLTSQLAHSKTISCSTHPLSTSYIFVVEGNKANLTIIHHNGIEHAPLLNGVITEYTLPIAEKRFEYAKKMGQSFSVDFDLTSCNFKENNELSCFHKEPATIGSLQVENYYFSIHKYLTKTSFGDFEDYIFNFEYRIGSWSHPVRIEFYSDACVFE